MYVTYPIAGEYMSVVISRASVGSGLLALGIWVLMVIG